MKKIQLTIKSKETMKNKYQKNYDKLLKVIPQLKEKILNVKDDEELIDLYLKSKSSGFMDLVFEYRRKDGEGIHDISLAHTYVQNGDLMSDPFMELRVDFNLETVEAIYFEMSCPPVSTSVYPAKGMVSFEEKVSQNQFLSQWLTNLICQGHMIK